VRGYSRRCLVRLCIYFLYCLWRSGKVYFPIWRTGVLRWVEQLWKNFSVKQSIKSWIGSRLREQCCHSLFAGEQIELVRPFIAALLGIGLKPILLFQMSPRTTCCSRATVWVVGNYKIISEEMKIVSHNCSYCVVLLVTCFDFCWKPLSGSVKKYTKRIFVYTTLWNNTCTFVDSWSRLYKIEVLAETRQNTRLYSFFHSSAP
jgi:hypothetical protein